MTIWAIGLFSARATDYLGGGQSDEVNAILNPEVLIVRNGFGQDLIRVPITQAVMLVPLGLGGSSAELQYKFSGADPETFSARLGKQGLSFTDLSSQGVRVIDVPIAAGRNVMTASVSGTMQSGQRGRDSDRITLVCCVPEAELPPVANAGPDRYSTPGSLVFLDGRGSSDPNGDELTYRWEQVNGPPVTLSDSGSPTPSFMFPSVPASTSLELELTVSDGLWTSFPDRVRISFPGDEPPVADAGPDQVVLSGATFTLDGSRSYDPAGGPITCSWGQLIGPAVLPPDPGGCVLTLAAPIVAGTVTLTFELTVTNTLGLSSTARGNVAIVGDEPPIADAGPDQTVFPGSAVTLDGSRSYDPNGLAITCSWRQIVGPATTLVNPMQCVAGFVTPFGAESVFTFELTVTNPLGLYSQDLTNITATPFAGLHSVAGAVRRR